MSKSVTLTIDNHVIEVLSGTSVLQACEQLGIEIPRFCFHDRLSVAGNCRMCLVEMERSPKPIASCAMPCTENMVVFTNTPMVKKARSGVMEFLLINHPLDCPICDQAGECDLQDQAMAYGMNGRFREKKRAVREKEFGPLIATAMTRCIHCTRCIRFHEEVGGVSELGTLGRGEDMEIDTYIEKAIRSELSGNLVDICPVGALTAKPYAFTVRPWELRKVESIDVLDAVGSNIRIDVRGGEVMRILPRLHEDINEEWISDKTRFAYDGLKYERLDRPYVRKEGQLQPVLWGEALGKIKEKVLGVSGVEIAGITGDLCDVESMVALKDLLMCLGSPHFDCRQDRGQYDTTIRSGYLFNTSIAEIECADVILLVGTNPRYEAPLINSRIYRRFRRGMLSIGYVGPHIELNYPYTHLGAGPHTVSALAQGDHEFCEVLRKARNPMMIVGMGALCRSDSMVLQKVLRDIAESFGFIREGWNGFNVLHTAAARVGGLDIGFLPQENGYTTSDILKYAKKGRIKVLYLLGADEIDITSLKNTFIIYQGHHGDRSARYADVILPGAAYTEKYGTYVNTEGRPQRARRAVFPPGQAREDWTILRALSEVLGYPLPYNTLGEIRKRLCDVNPIFAHIGYITPHSWGDFGKQGTLESLPFVLPIENFYKTDSISRASVTMDECTKAFHDKT